MASINKILQFHAPEYRSRFGRDMPAAHWRALQAITACQTGQLGSALAQCSHCGRFDVLLRSCRHRACPCCGTAKNVRWVEQHLQNLLPVPYFHLVFTIPQQLRRTVRSQQRVLFNILFRAAYEALSTLALDPQHLGGRIGAIAVLHTWSRTLVYHPHIHMLVPGVALSTKDDTLIEVRRQGREDFLVPQKPLAILFKTIFLDRARKALPDVDFPQLLWAKSWVVDVRKTLNGSPHRVLRYLGRYIHRTAISNSRIRHWDDNSVTFSYRDSRDGKHKTMELSAMEFIRRFLQHVVPKGFHRVRSYGLLHPHNQPLIRQLQQQLAPTITTIEESPDEQTSPTSTIVALPCPVCNKGFLIPVCSPLWASSHSYAPTPSARAPPATR